MTFGERLTELREDNHISRNALAEKLDVPYTTLRNYEKDAREPGHKVLVQLAAIFGVSVDYLIGVEQTKPPLPCSNEALSIARRYDALELDGKGAVRAILDYAESVREREETAKPTRIVPLFPAAAGPGEPAQDEYQETYEIPADSKAVCAVRISGDSMEPHLHDGEVYLVQDKRPAPGDVAVMLVDGAVYCKQYCKDSVGNLYLFSLNRQRKDKDVKVLHGSNSFVKCWGVVDCPRTPLPID